MTKNKRAYDPRSYRAHRIRLGNWERMGDDRRLLNAAIGLCAEAGEVADHIKKYEFHNKPIDAEEVLAEIGDVFHYLDEIMHQLGYELSDALSNNHQKLLDRQEKFKTFKEK